MALTLIIFVTVMFCKVSYWTDTAVTVAVSVTSSHNAASLLCEDHSVTFTRWCHCVPTFKHHSLGPTSSPLPPNSISVCPFIFAGLTSRISCAERCPPQNFPVPGEPGPHLIMVPWAHRNPSSCCRQHLNQFSCFAGLSREQLTH